MGSREEDGRDLLVVVSQAPGPVRDPASTEQSGEQWDRTLGILLSGFCMHLCTMHNCTHLRAYASHVHHREGEREEKGERGGGESVSVSFWIH